MKNEVVQIPFIKKKKSSVRLAGKFLLINKRLIQLASSSNVNNHSYAGRNLYMKSPYKQNKKRKNICILLC